MVLEDVIQNIHYTRVDVIYSFLMVCLVCVLGWDRALQLWRDQLLLLLTRIDLHTDAGMFHVSLYLYEYVCV